MTLRTRRMTHALLLLLLAGGLLDCGKYGRPSRAGTAPGAAAPAAAQECEDPEKVETPAPPAEAQPEAGPTAPERIEPETTP